MIEHLLKAGSISIPHGGTPMAEATDNGHIETVIALRDIALEVFGKEKGGELIEHMLEANKCAVINRADYRGYIEIKNLLVAERYAPQKLREYAAMKFYPSSLMGNAGLNQPKADNYCKVGEKYILGACLDVMGKFDELTQKTAVHPDLRKIISNYRDEKNRPLINGDDVDWAQLSEKTDNIRYKKIGEIADTVKEVGRYATCLIAAKNYSAETLKKVSPQAIHSFLGSLEIEINKYFLENKTLGQMAKMSDEWHKLRMSKVKLSKDGSTLRNFAKEGSWHQIAAEKEIAVTKPGLEGYSIVNLTNSTELTEEHNALGHCVDGYVSNCKKGYQVFSIRKDGVSQTTMGFNVVNGELKLQQNYGEGNRLPNTKENAVEKWFLDGIKKGTIKINLNQIGEITGDNAISAFENELGVMLKDLTPERINSNLKLLTGINRSKVYMFGHENKDATIEQFIENLENHKKKPVNTVTMDGVKDGKNKTAAVTM